MTIRYAPLPSHHPDRHLQDDIDSEMHAAFDYSEDEEEDNSNPESRPLNPVHTSPSSARRSAPGSALPGSYDFENIDYDYPPPGSPPRPSSFALPNEHGNTNGLIPTFDNSNGHSPRQNWLQRTAQHVLPSTFAERVGIRPSRPTGAVGGGTHNDGVFANVTAKPSAPVRIREGDETYLVPEDSRNEAPPSYAAAQADAVPPYWDTVVHAPFAPDAVGEMIIDSLPTGSLFSFLWNMLVSISFQFVGFLLTYLLHTTHAARLGSRAGLGVTLIQYGFALRSRMDSTDGEPVPWTNWKPSPYDLNNATLPNGGIVPEKAESMFADATTEWLSFFLMTIGWFILLTSILGFWRVKRWERGILASQREPPGTTIDAQRDAIVVSQLHHSFNLRNVSWPGLLRQGFGLGRGTSRGDESTHSPSDVEEGLMHHDNALETDSMLPSSAASNSTSTTVETIAR